jgi:16S rRNA (guanine966-N2)-methyltransferase
MSSQRPRTPGRIRIIGGRWRGRKLPVLDRPGLRPTPDRVRETLFNWLTPWLPGARVLDLCAGTGVLGLEALSRGAAHATLVDHDPELAGQIAAWARALDGTAAVEVVTAEARRFLAGDRSRYDLVFFDPPYDAGLWPEVLPHLPESLKDGALLYLEFPGGGQPPLPAGFVPHRRARAGAIEYGLWRYAPTASASSSRSVLPGP